MNISPTGHRTALRSLPTWGGSVVARALAVTLVAACLFSIFTVAVAPKARAAGDPCAAPTNPVLCENSKTGTPEDVWDVPGAGDSSIQGFATEMSVNVGQTESFKVQTSAAYKIDIYRLGYYGGDGARFITNIPVTARTQPTCITDNTVHLIDCGNWAVSGSWAVPSTAVSGVYIARLTKNGASGSDGASQVPFVVRNDASTSSILMQTSDTTWQAYNNYGSDNFGGGANFYGGSSYDSNNRAYKLSYNRPFITRGWEGGRDYLFSNEYPMIRFLEENGYDVSYISGIDTSRNGALLKQHKVFLTAGHDEYWDTVQRANVKAARDAGVNLAFFSGNDDYWKTRYENSTDSSNTPYRTLVSYKETWANGKIDPSSLWTGTWRDPRFSPPGDGDNPENALGGTLFMSNITDLPLTVNSTEGKLRIWRNTSLATMASGSSTALAQHTVGYESNEDLDNGFRPAGLIDMSTVSGAVPNELQDFGTQVAAGTTTHHITLYKAPSGALVFSAGTIQWAWGLDDDHDGVESAADPRIQQATVNLLADMGAQPLNLLSSLHSATASTDSSAPTSVVTSPAAGATIANGATVTATGTATDTGGGVVGGVEVSVDGGSTWHPATGRATWSYTFVAHGSGQVAILSRATDDSGNIESPSAGHTVTENCPCSLFGAAVPTTVDSTDTSNVELGVKFSPTADGYISGIRFYKASGNTGTHTGTLWSSTGTQLATGTFSGETASGWQTMSFASPVAVSKGTTYVASYRAPNGHYSADALFFSTRDWLAGPLTALRSTPTSGNGVYADGGSFPSSTYQDENYYVDTVFTASNTAPPVVSAATPRSGQKGVAAASVVTATFNAPVTAGSAQIAVKNGSTAVAGSTAYDAASQTATFTPSASFAAATTYTVTVSGATSSSGVTMTPASWTFTTDSSASCPCSLFGTTSVPTAADSGDGSSVEVGTRFVPSASGLVTGVRFYKSAANTGTHTGTLWSATGTALATGTFTGETASGWQTLTFASPVSVTAGSAYVASYLAPSGHYAADASFFTTPYASGSQTAPASNNGVFTYGAGGTLPANTFGATNYWVDALFIPGTTAPTVTSTTPAAGATGVGVGSTVSATFSVPVQAGSPQITLTGPGTTAVSGTVAVSGSVATFTPDSALTASTTYTATVSGAKNSSGATMAAPVTWTFSTTAPATCPCSLFAANAVPGTADSGDTSPVQVGVRFTPASSGYVTGMRFYKAAANTGTHTGTLWSPTGTALATGTFTSEPASGWSTLTFPTAVAVTAGSTYTASYLAPKGHYSYTENFFTSPYSNGPLVAPSAGGNGVYVYGTAATMPTSAYQATNYWVDVSFVTSTSTAPTVSSTLPAPGATSVAVGTSPTATFSIPVTSASVAFTLKTTTGGTAVAGTVSYDAASSTATFNPGAALATSTQYTATVSGASSSSGGVAMTAPYSWSFTTAAPSSCPCSLFSSSTTPSVVDSDDSSAVQLGVRVTPSVNGTITGIKFYKAATNTGTHTGTLWSPAGAALATGTFTGETASGWQTLTFATPVAVTAGSSYTASYLAPNGHYSADTNFFGSPYSNGPLTAPSAGGNGVYLYGSGTTTVPTSTYQASNYWVDVLLSTGVAAADVTSPTITGVTASGSGSTGTVAWSTDEASTSVVAYGTSATALTSSAGTAGSVTAHSVALTGLTAGTTYYYRVTSADPAGNSTTSPVSSAAAAQFTPATPVAGSLTQASTADFTAGTQSSTYVSPRSDGGVTLAPAVTQEFNGTAVPTGWSSTSLATGSSVTVAGGTATVSGRLLRTTATYATGREVDAVATLKAVNGQWLGVTDGGFTGSTKHWAAFRTSTTGGLLAETDNGLVGASSATLSSALLGGSHHWEISWTASSTVFKVDGSTVATLARGVSSAMYAAAQDGTVDANPLVLDSLWVSPYAATGTFTSSVLDAAATATWGTFTPTVTAPTGTSVTYQVRTGPNATAGGTGWSAWTTVAAGGNIAGATRYLQYKAVLSSTATATSAPTVTSVKIGYTS